MQTESDSKASRLLPVDGGIIAVIVLMVVIAYARTVTYGFINYDDDHYVYANPGLAQGMTPAAIGWAFTTFHYSSWHPLTWLSHLIDVTLFGMNAGGHHAVNVLFHGATSVLLFLALFRLTGARWPSAVVAALFAVHPLHVEPVVWISSRKDMLSTFFWVAALWAYAGYGKRGGMPRFLAFTLLGVAALLSKSMAMTLPFTLLLLDAWPLARLEKNTVVRCVVEKLPLFLCAALAGTLTFLAQQQGESLMSSDRIPLVIRIQNALVSCGAYLWKTVWPEDMAPFYPYPEQGLPFWAVLLSLVILLGLTSLAWLFRRKSPAMLIGWLWFLGTLVPVIGLVQTGSHAMADRFAYVPHIGLFIALVWGIYDTTPVRRRAVLLAPAGIICLTFLIITLRQAALWSDPVILFQHSLNVGGPSLRMHNNLGNAYILRNEPAPAVENFTRAIDIDPNAPDVYTNLGAAYLMLNSPYQAIPALEKALDLGGESATTLTNYGYALALAGKPQEGLEAAQRASQLNPGYGQAQALVQAIQNGAIQPVPQPEEDLP